MKQQMGTKLGRIKHGHNYDLKSSSRPLHHGQVGGGDGEEQKQDPSHEEDETEHHVVAVRGEAGDSGGEEPRDAPCRDGDRCVEAAASEPREDDEAQLAGLAGDGEEGRLVVDVLHGLLTRL